MRIIPIDFFIHCIYFLGTLIPKNCVDLLKKTLSSDAEKVDEETYENPIIKIEIKT